MKRFLLASVLLLIFLSGCSALREASSSSFAYKGEGLFGEIGADIIVVSPLATAPCLREYEERQAEQYAYTRPFWRWTTAVPRLGTASRSKSYLSRECRSIR